jgi:hypothetical protein
LKYARIFYNFIGVIKYAAQKRLNRREDDLLPARESVNQKGNGSYPKDVGANGIRMSFYDLRKE